MPPIDQDGLSRDELAAVRAALARDPALAAELRLILPALDPPTRRAFWAEFAATCGGPRPAAAVLAALTRTAQGR